MPVDRSIHGSGACGNLRAHGVDVAAVDDRFAVRRRRASTCRHRGCLGSATHAFTHSSRRFGARRGVGLSPIGIRRRRPSRQLDGAADSMVRSALELIRHFRSRGVAPPASARCSSCSWLPPWLCVLITAVINALVPVAVQPRPDRRRGKHAHRPAQPERPCGRRRQCPRDRRHRGGAGGGRADRRPRHGRARCGGRQPRRHRKSRRELLRRRRRAALLAGRRRAAGRRLLQGHQHRRQHDRPQERALSRLRLGGRAPRRSRQLAGVATGGTVHRRCRGAAAGVRCADGVARRRPRRAPPPLAQCRLAGSGDGGRAWVAARRPARLRQASPSTTIGWATGTAEAGPADIRRALRLYRTACLLQALVVAALAVVFAI